MEVIRVRDDIEPKMSGQNKEEHMFDANSKVYDTFMVGETIEAARGKLEDRKNQGMDTYGVFKSFFHFFFVIPTPSVP